MKLLRAFGRFWYDFLVGDDWKIAASVVVALVALAVLVRSEVLGDQAITVIGALAVMLAFTVSLLVDVHQSGKVR